VPPIRLITYPPLVQFVGTFYAPEEKEHEGGMNTLPVLVDKKEWIFKIKKAVDLTGDMTELGILEHIWPPNLKLRGTADLLDILQKPDLAGKPIAIMGHPYFSERMLVLDSVRDLTEKEGKQGKEQEKGKKD